jgi:membrane protein implicated in regulation of membrane protease activity
MMNMVAIAWIYVVLMMSAAEAVSPRGSLLGALLILVFYGVLPLAIVLYVMGAPARRRARRRAEEQARSARPAGDGGSHAAGDAVAPEREEA